MAVFIDRVTEYDLQTVRESIRRGMQETGLNFTGKKSAVIKINVVQTRAPETGIVTHPVVTEAVIDLLQEQGITDITIAEGPALGVDVREAFEVSGYKALAKRKGAQLLDNYKCRRAKLQMGYGYPNLPCVYDDKDLPKWNEGYLTVPEIFTTADVYVNIPKMKTHNRTKITLSLKNQWGLLDFRERQNGHTVGLHEPIAHLAKGIRPNMVVVDGIEGMEGNGPILGKKKKAEVLLVGPDAVETDVVGCLVMKQDPREIEHIRQIIDDLGIGSWNYQTRGLSIDEVVTQFDPADLVLKKSFNFYLWRNHRACHLDDDSFSDALRIAKKTPKYWFTFLPKLAYYMIFKRLDVIRGRGMSMPDIPPGGKIIMTGECVRDLISNFEEVPANVVFVPGCPPKPEDIIRAIIEM